MKISAVRPALSKLVLSDTVTPIEVDGEVVAYLVPRGAWMGLSPTVRDVLQGDAAPSLLGTVPSAPAIRPTPQSARYDTPGVAKLLKAAFPGAGGRRKK